jgi:competence ComEA-like helix-hairpin-helix protein
VKTNHKTVNPNDASVENLMTIKGIGQELAERIIEARPFDSIEDLKRVNGIGKKFLDNIRSELLIESESEVPFETINNNDTDREPTKEETEYVLSSSQKKDDAERPIDKEAEAWTEDIIENEFLDEISEDKENSSDEIVSEESADKKEAPFLVGEKLVAHSTLDEEEKARVHTQKFTRKTTPFTRIQAFWISVSVSFFTLMISLFLTFGILAALNSGHLKYSLPSQYNALDLRVKYLESQITNMGQEIEGMRVRVDNLETLGNRIERLEQTTEKLQTDLQAASSQVDELYREVTDVRTELDNTKETISSIQLFFEGLQKLLSELFSEEASE